MLPQSSLPAGQRGTVRWATQLTILSPTSESDGNPATEDESSRSPEDLERGVAPGAAEPPAQGSVFLAGAAPPTPCPASSSILVNGSFLAAGSSPAVLLNGSPVIINSLALGEASSLGPLLLTGGGGAPAPQPSPQGPARARPPWSWTLRLGRFDWRRLSLKPLRPREPRWLLQGRLERRSQDLCPKWCLGPHRPPPFLCPQDQ